MSNINPMTDKRKATRAKLLAAARELFDELGFEKTNIIAVAHRAGVTKGAIYNNWNNKADLWAEVYGKPYVSPEGKIANAIVVIDDIADAAASIDRITVKASVRWLLRIKEILND